MTAPHQPSPTVLENDHVWTRQWVCVGVEQQIPSPGDLLPATVGDHGLHVQRQGDGSLRASFNILQYGSCWTIPAQCGNGHKTRCPYVSCAHSLDTDAIPAEAGAPTREMRQFIGFNPLKLLPVPLTQLGPLLFVCLESTGPPNLREQLEGVASAVQQSSLEGLEYAGRFWAALDCHWALASDALFDALDASCNGHIMGEPVAPDELLAPPGLVPLRKPGRGDEMQTACYHGFPNVALVLLPSHVAAIIVKPTRIDGVALLVNLYVAPGTPQAAQGEEPTRALIDAWKRVCREARVRSGPLQAGTSTSATPRATRLLG